MVRKARKKAVSRAKDDSRVKASVKPFLEALAAVRVGRGRKEKTGPQKLRLKQEKSNGGGKIKIRNNTKLSPAKAAGASVPSQSSKGIVLRSKLQVALLSPFRFPMPSERTMVSVARYSGVFFVAVGAFFAFLNLPYAGGAVPEHMKAELYDSTTTPTTTTDGTSSGNQIDTTPDVRVTVENVTGEMLSGMAPIMVTVPFANEVKLIADDRLHDTLITLGIAFRVDDSTWRFYWDTRQYPNSEYRIKVIVKNQYGMYDYTDSKTYLVHNEFNTTQGTIPSTTTTAPSGTTSITSSTPTTTQTNSTTTSDTATTTTAAPSVDLRIGEASPVSGGVALKVFVPNAAKVEVYAKNTATAVTYFAGLGVFHEGNEWRLTWQSDKVPDGGYVLRAKATVGSTVYESGPRSVSVDNINEDEIEPLLSTTTATSTGITVQPYQPTVRLTLSKESPLSGFVDIFVNTSPVQGVELFLQPKTGLTPFFIGTAQRLNDETSWKLSWGTRASPNGDYYLFAKVKSPYGTVDGSKMQIKILNEVLTTFTDSQIQQINTMTEAADALVAPVEDVDDPLLTQPEPFKPPEVVYIEPVETFMQKVAVEDDTRNEIEDLLRSFREQLKDKLEELARAKRREDEVALAAVQDDIERIKKEVLLSLPAGLEQKEIIDSINTYLSQIAFELQELTLKNETILKERIGETILVDSDKDGISDYDEINLYQTNPFAADTDGDGYLDGTEISLGYDPHDSRSEAMVTYESPKESGITREDLLVVDSILTLTIDEERDDAPKALISGKGLPNSFVTLYIFSTPIVVTVKTDAEGAWSYVFDKELEDGAHEVYIGITDNAGRVVAKSNPLPFVKTAEAFTGATGTVTGDDVSSEAPSLLEGRVMLLVASVAIVALGLVLILLGFHVSNRRPEAPNIVAV